jgi:hypothetical protein
MTKAETKAATTEVSTAQAAELADVFGTANNVSSNDIIIPKLMCMQGLSQLVMDGKARFGEFVDSTTEEVVGNIDTGIELIPFMMEKLWYLSERVGDDYEFKGIEPVTPANENSPYEFMLDGKAMKRQMVRNFYFLNPNDMALPCIVSFKGMSTRAGKQLATLMYLKNPSEGKQPPAYHVIISGEKTKNDKGTFAVLKVSKGNPSAVEEQMEAAKWYKTIMSGQAKAHDVVEEAPKPQAAADDCPF